MFSNEMFVYRLAKAFIHCVCHSNGVERRSGVSVERGMPACGAHKLLDRQKDFMIFHRKSNQIESNEMLSGENTQFLPFLVLHFSIYDFSIS